MAIDTSDKWWRGADFNDLAEYIKLITAEGYPADQIVQSVCVCGNTTFRLLADPDEGCAQRICTACGAAAFIGDSDEYWEDAEARRVRCPRGHTILELGVGFSLRDDGDVKWITIGQRCVKCGVLARYVDWKINYSRSVHLLSMA
jgi:hypothetical protein